MSTKMGIVAYDQNSKSSDIYAKAFSAQFQQDDIEFIHSWDNIDALIAYTSRDGVTTLNELDKIIVLDEGFKNQINAAKMTEDFVSLEETFDNRGVNRPYLAYATTKQEVYDMFKNDETPSGHFLFPYMKTRVFKINKDQNGDVNAADIDKIVTGAADNTALSMRKDYKTHGDLLNERLKDIKNQNSGKDRTNIKNIRENIKQRARDTGINPDSTPKADKNQAVKENENRIFRAHDQYENSKIEITPDVKRVMINSEEQVKQAQTTSDETNINNAISTAKKYYQQQKADKYLPLDFSSKLKVDNGAILFSGRQGSGVTSLIYNVYNIYKLFNKSILILNIDQYDDIINYFPKFKQHYKEKNISKTLKTNFISLNDIFVNIDDTNAIISDYGMIQRSYNLTERIANIERIINVAKNQYDIVLIDGGIFFNDILLKAKNSIDNAILVTNYENIYTLDNINDDQQRLNNTILDFEKNHNSIGIIINKLDFKISDEQITDEILNLKTSLNRSRLVSTILYDKYWNLQLQSHIPYALQNQINFKIMKNIVERMIV